MECPSVSFSQRGSASRNKQDFVGDVPSLGRTDPHSPLLERHRVIHSHMTNWDGLKQDTPFTLFRQELNSARPPGRTMLFDVRCALGEAPSPGPAASPAQPVTHTLLPARRARAGNLGGAQVFAHGTPPHSRRVRDEWEIV